VAAAGLALAFLFAQAGHPGDSGTIFLLTGPIAFMIAGGVAIFLWVMAAWHPE
jgi:hypothetical protein